MLLERSGRVDNGVTLHLESVQREGDAGMVVSLAVGGVGVVESVFMEVQVCITANARHMR